MIIGTIAKCYALITTMELMKAGVSNRIPIYYYDLYTSNMEYLQRIKLLGSTPYRLTTYLNADTAR